MIRQVFWGVISLAFLSTLWIFDADRNSYAQTAQSFYGQQVNATIASANAYQSVPQLPLAPGRKHCRIQYEGTNTGLVFFGSTAPAQGVTNTGFQLAQRNFITCEEAQGLVEGDQVWISATNTGDIFVIKVK